jgi:hypothetical protein
VLAGGTAILQRGRAATATFALDSTAALVALLTP